MYDIPKTTANDRFTELYRIAKGAECGYHLEGKRNNKFEGPGVDRTEIMTSGCGSSPVLELAEHGGVNTSRREWKKSKQV